MQSKLILNTLCGAIDVYVFKIEWILHHTQAA